MAVTSYIVHDFKYNEVTQGALTAMVLNTTADGAVLTTGANDGQDENPLKGVGIVRVVSQNTLTLTINSITYSFNTNGLCITGSYINYKLMLAEVQDKASEVGTGVETDGTIMVGTRGLDGKITYTEEEGNSIIISNLEARDQFALYALKTLMERADRDITYMSDNEKMHYCEVAYQWAANMMTQASKVRAVIKSEDSGGGSGEIGSDTEEVKVDASELTDTSDKLLNNLIAELGKNDYAKDTGKKDKDNNPIYEYSNRIINPEMNALWNEFVSHTEEPEEGSEEEPVTKRYGLYDLIEAIKEGSGGGGKIPSRQDLSALVAEDEDATKVLHDFFTFNAAGDAGYSTKAEVVKAVWAEITAEAIWQKIQDIVDARIKQWLESARITITSPAGTFDATFDITFQDMDVLANFIVNTPT